ncbi:lytic transglycosylase domain-containing protein [Nitrosomonas sp. Is37]|uniref:lytic transglycosylase domain-containing protein n=1 Tax=Nitrosomonas sp. Is37 TaxID=3080535 RepID=UPI00294B7EC8|nr:lytic transglycosylase domain-containing protein [Nitrosomonas sp. Is37]MDV6345839.1 lytic transglycosylase domain-containing protein [Nitrosomonas sp. Is37]
MIFFRRLSLATAWQESCWRQFIKKSGRLEPLMSHAGAIGIMQVNPNVWRGFYEIPALRNDISYNASAGNEILHHYLTDYVLIKNEHKETNSFDHLARLTYVAYNGCPAHFERYRKKSASKGIYQIASAFWQKVPSFKNKRSTGGSWLL